MKKHIVIEHRIPDLLTFFRNTDADEIIVRTSYVDGGWHDNEFDAHYAGFQISRFINEDYVGNHTSAECYRLTRK